MSLQPVSKSENARQFVPPVHGEMGADERARTEKTEGKKDVLRARLAA
jgi:hypothetical protein